MVEGAYPLFRRGESSDFVVAYRSNLKPLVLVRKLLRKSWFSGFSCKEYLICFNILISNTKRWSDKQVRSVVILFMLREHSRKTVLQWDEKMKSGRKLFADQMRKYRGNMEKQLKLLDNETRIFSDFLNVPDLDKKELDMRVFDKQFKTPPPKRYIGISASNDSSNSTINKITEIVVSELEQLSESRGFDELVKESNSLVNLILGVPKHHEK